jgi:hypothetical protein
MRLAAVGTAWLSKVFSCTNFHEFEFVTADKDNSRSLSKAEDVTAARPAPRHAIGPVGLSASLTKDKGGSR